MIGCGIDSFNFLFFKCLGPSVRRTHTLHKACSDNGVDATVKKTKKLLISALNIEHSLIQQK